MPATLFSLLLPLFHISAMAQRSCDWRDLSLRWPVDLDPEIRPGYGKLDGMFRMPNYVGFPDPRNPTGPLLDYTGAPRGHNGVDIVHLSCRNIIAGGDARVVAAAGGNL